MTGIGPASAHTLVYYKMFDKTEAEAYQASILMASFLQSLVLVTDRPPGGGDLFQWRLYSVTGTGRGEIQAGRKEELLERNRVELQSTSTSYIHCVHKDPSH